MPIPLLGNRVVSVTAGSSQQALDALPHPHYMLDDLMFLSQ